MIQVSFLYIYVDNNITCRFFFLYNSDALITGSSCIFLLGFGFILQDQQHNILQGVKLIFFSRSHLAPKYFKVVANSKKLAIIMAHTQTIFTLSLYQID